jgi:hypothetical protein
MGSFAGRSCGLSSVGVVFRTRAITIGDGTTGLSPVKGDRDNLPPANDERDITRFLRGFSMQLGCLRC